MSVLLPSPAKTDAVASEQMALLSHHRRRSEQSCRSAGTAGLASRSVTSWGSWIHSLTVGKISGKETLLKRQTVETAVSAGNAVRCYRGPLRALALLGAQLVVPILVTVRRVWGPPAPEHLPARPIRHSQQQPAVGARWRALAFRDRQERTALKLATLESCGAQGRAQTETPPASLRAGA